jgi:hypothetical protein
MGLKRILCIVGLLVGCGEPTAELATVGGPALVRQITDGQYRSIIADVFGADVPVVAKLPDGIRAYGLKAIGTTQMGMSAVDVELYDKVARSISAAVVSPELSPQSIVCDVKTDTCLTEFIKDIGPKLLRRPLNQEEIDYYEMIGNAAKGGTEGSIVAIQYALHAMLISPDMIFRFELGQSDQTVSQLAPFEKASRLSFFLTNSAPDTELFTAAANGELETIAGREKQIARMMQLPAFETATRAFFEDMLEFELFDSLAKDPSIFVAFSSQLMSDAREQTLRTLIDHLIFKNADYRDIFITRETYLTRALGIVYRLPVEKRNGWQKVEYPEESMRQGILTDMSFLALHSHPGRSSASLRGKALRQIFLCQDIPDPPANVNFAILQDPSNKSLPTARDRLIMHRTEPSCSGCHKIMDPIGLGFENFDGIGTYRVTENSANIDISGELDGQNFTSLDELTLAIRNHPEVSRCLVEKLYRFAIGRDTVWEERSYMDGLLKIFERSGYRYRELVSAIAKSENFYTVDPHPTKIEDAPRISRWSH